MAFGVGHVLFLTSPIGPTREIVQSCIHLAVLEVLQPNVIPHFSIVSNLTYLGGHYPVPTRGIYKEFEADLTDLTIFTNIYCANRSNLWSLSFGELDFGDFGLFEHLGTRFLSVTQKEVVKFGTDLMQNVKKRDGTRTCQSTYYIPTCVPFIAPNKIRVC